MAKIYERVNWEDLPSKNTPINAENLNKMDEAIDKLDDKIVELEESASSGDEYLEKENPTGTGSFSMNNGTASGNSMAWGTDCNASGGGVAMGWNCYASGGRAFALGMNCSATGSMSFAINEQGYAPGTASFAGGCGGWALGKYSFAHGNHPEASGESAAAFGRKTTANNAHCLAIGQYNKSLATGASEYSPVGDVFCIGNGTLSGSTVYRANAFRVTFLGETYGLSAFNSSGADYAEFIKPWADGNVDGEDRVGYFVTVEDGLLRKANDGDYIIGITSGNPSIVGNSDEDYYCKYERDDFNRIIMEDIAEIVEEKDEDGNEVIRETGNIIKNARMKLSDNYDSTLEYIPRKLRKEWDYVGMLGVLPVRDDGTCEVGKFCKCGIDGIATLAEARGFDTYMVIDRVSENVVNVVLK